MSSVNHRILSCSLHLECWSVAEWFFFLRRKGKGINLRAVWASSSWHLLWSPGWKMGSQQLTYTGEIPTVTGYEAHKYAPPGAPGGGHSVSCFRMSLQMGPTCKNTFSTEHSTTRGAQSAGLVTREPKKKKNLSTRRFIDFFNMCWSPSFGFLHFHSNFLSLLCFLSLKVHFLFSKWTK